MGTRRDEIAEWREHARQSRQALPVGIGCAAVLGGIAWLAQRRLGLPWWSLVLVGAVAVFGPVGDTINLLVLRRRLRRIERAESRSSDAPGASG